MKPTLKEIAEQTGCSISTVSRSLAHSASISKKTKDHVQQVARKLGYEPAKKKPVPRKKSKKRHFALLSDFRVAEFYAAFFLGYRKASYHENVRISLMSISKHREECVKLVQEAYRGGNYDGIILFFPSLQRTHYEQIIQVLPKNYPLVSNALIDNPNITTVTFDSYNGGYLAASHLHEQGYRRLGVIEGPTIRPESRFRYNGFMDYVNQYPELSLTWRAEGEYEFESGVNAFEDFRKRMNHDQPGEKTVADAVFATNDSMAAGFMESARTAGLDVPGDVAVLGYDNLPTCIHRTTQISSIVTDFATMAGSSIKTLKNIIENQDYQRGTLSLIPVRLSAKASTLG